MMIGYNVAPMDNPMNSTEGLGIGPYSSVDSIIRAFKNGQLTYTQAYNALVIQYGFSDTDASESLRTDEEIQVIDETREIEAESNRANILGDESFPKPARILGQSPDDFIIKLFGLAIILVGLNYMGVK